MNAILAMFGRAVRRSPLAVVLTIVVLTGVFGALSSNPETAAGFDTFAGDGDVATAQATITDRFTSDEAGNVLAQLVIVDQDGDVLSPSGVSTLQTLLADVSADPAVVAVAAPLGPDGPTYLSYADTVLMDAAADGIDIATLTDDALDARYTSLLDGLPDDAAAQQAVLLGGTIDGADATAGMFIFSLDSSASDADLAAARDVINTAAGTLGDYEVYSFDFEALNAEVESEMASQMGLLLGIAFLLIILILVGIYRSAIDVIASIVGLAFTIVWAQGLGVLLGPDYLGVAGYASQMSMMIPILLVGLGVDYGIHLTMRTREEKASGVDVEHAGSRAIGAVGTALILATITTVVGFLTNLANPLPPLRDFGIFAAVGVIAAFVVMTLFVPSVRLLADRRAVRRGKVTTTTDAVATGPGLLGRVAASFAPIAVGRPMIVLGVAGALALAGGFGATQLSTEFSQTDFFPEGSRALETIEVITDSFGGGFDEATTVVVEGDVTTAEAWNGIRAFQLGLADVADVRGFDGQAQADSVVTRARLLGLSDADVSSDADVAELMDAVAAADPTLASLVTDERDAALVVISTSAGENVDNLSLAINELAATTLEPAGLDVGVASDSLLINEILGQLRDSQIQGLAITLVASMLILALVFHVRRRAAMLGVIAIGAVAVATAWVLGIMALVGIPFNVLTAMVSALAIGIGVPFGIHVVNRFVEDRATAPDTLTAMTSTLQNTGGALVGSAFTTMAGFGVLMVSSVTPMRQFGLVTALTIGLALIASLMVLPAMLALWARRTASGTTTSADTMPGETNATTLDLTPLDDTATKVPVDA